MQDTHSRPKPKQLSRVRIGTESVAGVVGVLPTRRLVRVRPAQVPTAKR